MKNEKENNNIVYDFPEDLSIYVAIVSATWHPEIVKKLKKTAIETLEKNGFCSVEHYKKLGELVIPKTYHHRHYEIFNVPGTYEIPLATKLLLDKFKFWDKYKFFGIITLGTVIKGETDHNFYINTSVSQKLMNLMTEYKIPIGFGIITAFNYQQAMQRINKGEEAANATLHMIDLIHKHFPGKLM